MRPFPQTASRPPPSPSFSAAAVVVVVVIVILIVIVIVIVIVIEIVIERLWWVQNTLPRAVGSAVAKISSFQASGVDVGSGAQLEGRMRSVHNEGNNTSQPDRWCPRRCLCCECIVRGDCPCVHQESDVQ